MQPRRRETELGMRERSPLFFHPLHTSPMKAGASFAFEIIMLRDMMTTVTIAWQHQLYLSFRASLRWRVVVRASFVFFNVILSPRIVVRTMGSLLRLHHPD